MLSSAEYLKLVKSLLPAPACLRAWLDRSNPHQFSFTYWQIESVLYTTPPPFYNPRIPVSSTIFQYQCSIEECLIPAHRITMWLNSCKPPHLKLHPLQPPSLPIESPLVPFRMMLINWYYILTWCLQLRLIVVETDLRPNKEQMVSELHGKRVMLLQSIRKTGWSENATLMSRWFT